MPPSSDAADVPLIEGVPLIVDAPLIEEAPLIAGVSFISPAPLIVEEPLIEEDPLIEDAPLIPLSANCWVGAEDGIAPIFSFVEGAAEAIEAANKPDTAIATNVILFILYLLDIL
jgi:hypothetical protein